MVDNTSRESFFVHKDLTWLDQILFSVKDTGLDKK